MFKVFHRGHSKVQFNSTHNTNSNELASNTSINKIKSANLASSYDHIRRRNSIRSTSVFGDADLDSLSMSRSNLTANKKYVSCDNFARNFEDDYQEVIDEEFDEENSFKNKLLKPYNSVTNLLMRSFRKARIKKKKEAMLQENHIDENEIQHMVTSNNSKSKPPSRRASVYMEQDETREDENENSSKMDESIPVFKGSRIISNEFVELNTNKQQPQNQHKESVPPTTSKRAENFNKKEIINIIKKDESNSSNSNIKKPVNPVPSIRLNVETKRTPNSVSQLKSNRSTRIDNFGKIEQSSAIEVLQKFSSHMKPQAPKPPESQTQPPQVVTQSQSVELNSESESVKPLPLAPVEQVEKKEPETAPRKPAVIKRRKTFTEQLQDMLKDHRNSRPEMNSPSVLIRKPENKQLEKSFVASVISDDKSLKSNTNMSHMTSSLIIDSSISRKHELSQDYFDLLEDVNFQFKSINDFNKMQLIETNSINGDDFASVEKHDEFKDLIHVLSRQEPEFKKKIFDCLMTKLWDPALPINEYVQLNKLMVALFGENYHKIDSSYNTLVRNVDYLNFKSNKNSQVDAEYIVNLMKVYLDSKSKKSNSVKNLNNEEHKKSLSSSSSNNSNDENDLSISNLINSLQNRQKNESIENNRIATRSTNLNSLGSNIYDLDEKLQLYGNEFSFRNGFNGLTNNLANKAKSSLVLKVDDPKEDEVTYNKESFINHSILEDYSCKTSIINDESVANHFQRDSKLRKTLINHERPQVTSTSQLSNKSINEEIIKNKKLSVENKIGKIIKINRLNVASPLNSNDKSTNSINNEISMITNNINMLSMTNLSDSDQKSSLINYSTKPPEQMSKTNKIASFQPEIMNKIEQYRTKSEKVKPTYNVVRTVVQPPKPKLAIQKQQPDNDYLLKQKQFKVVNIFKNVNENILNIKHTTPYVATTTSMRKRDGQFFEPKFVYHNNVNNSEEPIYQVQKLKHAEFNPIGSINKSIRNAYVYIEEKNSKSLNHLNDEYAPPQQHSRVVNQYAYEPVKKKVSHHLKDLMTEKFYKFERKEMQQAFY